LLDYGFSMLESRLLCAKGQLDLTLPVVSGLSDHVKVTNSDEVSLTTTKDASRAEVVYELDRFVYAPVREGQVLGRAVWYINGKEVAETQLVAQFSVDLKKYSKGILGSLFD
jgi:D-alanyl-D-alanine carboxypeptidase